MLLLAVPLVGAAWLPWWAVLGLTLALALTLRGEEVRLVRVPLLLLGAGVGLVATLPELRGPAGAAAFVRLFLTVMGGTALVYLAVSALEERRVGWGAGWLAALLGLGAVVPGGSAPLGLAVGLLALPLALLGAAGAEDRPPTRLGGRRRAALGTAGAALALALVVGVLAFALPGTGSSRAPGGTAPVPVETRESAPPPTPTPPPTTGNRSASRPPRPVAAVPDRIPGTDLVLISGLLFFVALLFALWRARERSPGEPFRPRLWEVAAVLGLALTAALLLAFSLAVRAGAGEGAGLGAASGAAAVPPQALTRPPDAVELFLERGLWVLSLLAFLVFTGLAAGLFWLGLRLRRGEGEDTDEDAVPDLPPGGEEGAVHRVRRAYRAALASLAAAGLGRGEAETPAEHAGRVAGTHPALAGPLGTLVTAYAPVRYGGRVTEEGAGAAEEAAREVARLAAQGGLDTQPTESETP